MFWLPRGLFPYHVEWFASFPRAPMGSVSITVWQWACTGVLALLMEAVTGALGLAVACRKRREGGETSRPGRGRGALCRGGTGRSGRDQKDFVTISRGQGGNISHDRHGIIMTTAGREGLRIQHES